MKGRDFRMEIKVTHASNGFFIQCPRCKRTMANGAMGNAVCIVGCGYSLPRKETQAALEQAKKDSK